MIKTIIIDDEKNARVNTLNIINTFCSNIEVVALADGVKTGIEKIKEFKPELVLLDIDMNDGTGFDLLQALAPIDFCVVFVTAHVEEKTTAIKFNALDFLVKPLDPEDFLLAINKAVLQLKDRTYQQRINNLLSDVNRNELPKIALSNSEAVYFVKPDEIIRIEADANYAHFYLASEKKITISKPLKEYAELLENYGFFRCHQSHLVNLNFTKKFVKKDGGYLELSLGSSVPVSQRKREKLLKAIKGFIK